MVEYHTALSHWADQNAQKIIGTRKNADGSPRGRYVCASGITPSGTVHIGNFREIISVDLVHRALLDRGIESRFMYSWDDYDAFRKVPANIPDREKFEQYLRQPIVDIPDPWNRESSYARAQERAVEIILPTVGIEPEYLYQTEKYRAGEYAHGIRRALENREKIRVILNEKRTTPLPADWWPLSIFSAFTGRDTTTVLSWDGEWALTYRCSETEQEETIDFRNIGQPAAPQAAPQAPAARPSPAGVKLLWRVDWPMRWAFEQVDFEPAGKEHHSAGGSFDTAKIIAREVYNYEAPVTFKYDFISIKGRGGKISSSLGNVISLAETLEIYQPEVLRYLFAGIRPNAEFAISFDLDVIKIYEDYDRCERIYYGLEDVNEKRLLKEGRIYELSQVDRQFSPLSKEKLQQFPFRHLCNLLLIHNGNVDAALQAFPSPPDTPANDPARARDTPARARGNALLEGARRRAQCAWNWLKKYAPEDFRFTINEVGKAINLSPAEKDAISTLHTDIGNGALECSDKELQDRIYDIARKHELEPKDFFAVIYMVLITKKAGPRLASFLKIVGKERLRELLQSAITRTNPRHHPNHPQPNPEGGRYMTPNTNELKKQAAYRAVDDIIRSGSKVGLGTGSTARHVVHRLAEHLNSGRLKSVLTVATSNNTRELCRELHIPVFSLNDSRIAGRLDYAIDGADEVSPMNDLIKGGGAAHLLEKIVAYSAEHFYVVVDESKLVTVLNRAFAVPLEIIPEAQASLIRVLEKEHFSVRLRMIGQMDAGTPVLTDSRNRILDLFAPGKEGMEKGGPYDPARMESYFNSLPGIVESGLFTCPVRAVYIGAENGVVVRK